MNSSLPIDSKYKRPEHMQACLNYESSWNQDGLTQVGFTYTLRVYHLKKNDNDFVYSTTDK